MARSFNGSTDQVNFGLNAAWEVGLTSATAWINFASDFTAERLILAKLDNAFNGRQWLQTIGANQNDFFCTIGYTVQHAQARSTANALISGNIWQFVAMTHDEVVAPKLYTARPGVSLAECSYAAQQAKDGVLQDGSAASLRIATRDIGDIWWAGGICQVGVWNRVLTSGELTQLSLGYTPAFFTSGLIFYAPLVGANSPEPNYATSTKSEGVITGTTKVANPDNLLTPILPMFNETHRPRPFAPGIAR